MWWLGVRQLVAAAQPPAPPESPVARARRWVYSAAFAAQTAHSRSPVPVSDVRRSLSARRRRPAASEKYARTMPHAAGVVGRDPALDRRGRVERRGERARRSARPAAPRARPPRMSSLDRSSSPRRLSRARRRTRRRRRAASTSGRRRTRPARRAGRRSARPRRRRGRARARRSRDRCRDRGSPRSPRRPIRLTGGTLGPGALEEAGREVHELSPVCSGVVPRVSVLSRA